MHRIVDEIIEHLSGTAVVGTRQPSRADELPRAVLSLSLTDDGDCLGRFIGSGFRLVQNTAIVEVAPGPEAFATDLRSLQIWPLPLRKDPASRTEDFSEQDLAVANVTDVDHRVGYRMVDEPTRAEEYKLDLHRGRIVFGQPQTPGERIEVVHWTVAWREDIRVERYDGVVLLEIWASNSDQVDEIARRLQDKLQSDRAGLRRRGFLKLRPIALSPIENQEQSPPTGSAFRVWKQRLEYRLVFEAPEGGELSGGARIRRIDVDADGHLVESFSVPQSI